MITKVRSSVPNTNWRRWVQFVGGALMIALLSTVSVQSFFAQTSGGISILLPLVIDGQGVEFIPHNVVYSQ